MTTGMSKNPAPRVQYKTWKYCDMFWVCMMIAWWVLSFPEVVSSIALCDGKLQNPWSAQLPLRSVFAGFSIGAPSIAQCASTRSTKKLGSAWMLERYKFKWIKQNCEGTWTTKPPVIEQPRPFLDTTPFLYINKCSLVTHSNLQPIAYPKKGPRRWKVNSQTSNLMQSCNATWALLVKPVDFLTSKLFQRWRFGGILWQWLMPCWHRPKAQSDSTQLVNPTLEFS